VVWGVPGGTRERAKRGLSWRRLTHELNQVERTGMTIWIFANQALSGDDSFAIRKHRWYRLSTVGANCAWR
jgi:hypothetical protein